MDTQSGASKANVKKGVKADFKIARLCSIRLMANKIASEVQIEFLEEYGRLYDLLFVDVKVAALHALTQFWNSDLGVFEMPHLDTVPVMEEYQQLLLFRMGQGIYIPGGDAPTNAMRKIIGLTPADHVERKENQGWLQSALERHLQKLVDQKEWTSFKPILALLIYRLVMFPSVPDTVKEAWDKLVLREDQQRGIARVRSTPEYDSWRAYVPAILKRAKTEASVQIHKLSEQLEARRQAMAADTRQKTELKEELGDFQRAVCLRDKRIAELERDLRMSQQHAIEGKNQVDHVIERASDLEEVQRRMNGYQEALARVEGKTKWYKRKVYELQSECNNMGLELNWKEEDKELDAARKTTEEVEECKEMWRHRSIYVLGHWETISYDWLEDFESVYKESIKVGASLPTKIRTFFNNYQNTAQGI
ncbi:hypothetical protein Lal_00034000 [Lupinus albus]|nr:hypothetical protein Lal_00034000 [Lupinus albus]